MAAHAHTRRGALTILAGVAVCGSVVSLAPAGRTGGFDPEGWVERWYRAGHRIVADLDGRPVLWSSLNSDYEEESATALRGELGYPGNRAALVRYLGLFRPSLPGTVCGYIGGVA